MPDEDADDDEDDDEDTDDVPMGAIGMVLEKEEVEVDEADRPKP